MFTCLSFVKQHADGRREYAEDTQQHEYAGHGPREESGPCAAVLESAEHVLLKYGPENKGEYQRAGGQAAVAHADAYEAEYQHHAAFVKVAGLDIGAHERYDEQRGIHVVRRDLEDVREQPHAEHLHAQSLLYQLSSLRL